MNKLLTRQEFYEMAEEQQVHRGKMLKQFLAGQFWEASYKHLNETVKPIGPFYTEQITDKPKIHDSEASLSAQQLLDLEEAA